MGEQTNISWCDATFNPWVGCTKISPACDGCYAEAMMDDRYGRVKWGSPDKPENGAGTRSRTSAANWKQPIKWNKEAETNGTRPRVFCASLADVFDNQVPPEWREDLFDLIRVTPNLIWLLLTKRPQNIVKMVRVSGAVAGNGTRYLPRNAALGTTIEDQTRADINIPHLLAAKEQCGPAFVFVSCEPLLGALDLTEWLCDGHPTQAQVDGPNGMHYLRHGAPRLGWVIAGGETDQGKHKARPSHPDWIRSLRDQCAASGTAFHFKQWGNWKPLDQFGEQVIKSAGAHAVVHIDGRFTIDTDVADPPRRVFTFNMGKKGGRLLDGIEHNGFPTLVNYPVSK